MLEPSGLTGACADDPARPAARRCTADGRRSPGYCSPRSRSRSAWPAAWRARGIPRLPGRRQPAVLGVHRRSPDEHAEHRRRRRGRAGPNCGTTARTTTRARPSSGSTWPRWDPAPRSRPGVSRLPGPGQYYASPALAALLRTVPPTSWATGSPARAPAPSARPRCPARTSWPSTSGYRPAALATLPGTRLVTTIRDGTGPARCLRRSSGTRSASGYSRCCSRC